MNHETCRDEHGARRSYGDGENTTYIVSGDARAERLGHVVVDGGAGLVCEVPGGGIRLELKLCPDDEVDDALVEAVGPVIEDDADVVVGVLEGQAAGDDGLLPAEALAEDEGGDGAVGGGLAVGVGLVAAQLGGDALEALELVGGDEGADLGPGEAGEGRVRGADDAAVLVAEVEEERRALRRPVGLGDVVMPVGDGASWQKEGNHGTGRAGGEIEYCLGTSLLTSGSQTSRLL